MFWEWWHLCSSQLFTVQTTAADEDLTLFLLFCLTDRSISGFMNSSLSCRSEPWTEQLQSCLACLGHHRALCFCLCVVSLGCQAHLSFLSRDVTFSVLEAPVQKEVERVVSDQRKVSFPTKVKSQIWLFWGSEHRLCPWWSWAVHMSRKVRLKPNFEQCKQEGE